MSPLRSLCITSWTRPPSEKSHSTSTGSGCTRCATHASSTMMWWVNTKRWSRTPATCYSWPGWRTKSASPPRPRAPGLQETWQPSSSTTSAPSTRRSCTTSIEWTFCSSTTLYQLTSSLDEAGMLLIHGLDLNLWSVDSCRRTVCFRDVSLFAGLIQTLQMLFKMYPPR